MLTVDQEGPKDVLACISPKRESWNWLCLASRRHIHIGLSIPNLVKGLATTWIAPICRILNFSL